MWPVRELGEATSSFVLVHGFPTTKSCAQEFMRWSKVPGGTSETRFLSARDPDPDPDPDLDLVVGQNHLGFLPNQKKAWVKPGMHARLGRVQLFVPPSRNTSEIHKKAHCESRERQQTGFGPGINSTPVEGRHQAQRFLGQGVDAVVLLGLQAVQQLQGFRGADAGFGVRESLSGGTVSPEESPGRRSRW